MNKKGLFITFEGVDGAGKTTVIKKVVSKLLTNLKDYSGIFVTREPGGENTFGAQIRKMFLNSNDLTPSEETILLLANRINHIKEIIQPKLEKNYIVISDRFSDSTFAYQGSIKVHNDFTAYDLNNWCVNLTPDLTFVLDIDPKLASERIAKDNQRTLNRFDKENLIFHQNIRQAFLTLKQKYPKRIHVIDATKEIDEIATEIVEIILCQSQNPQS